MKKGMTVTELRDELERLEVYGYGNRMIFDSENPDYTVSSVGIVDIDEYNAYDCDDDFDEVITLIFEMNPEYREE